MNRLSSLAWIQKMRETVPDYLARLSRQDQPGRFIPCLTGATPTGLAAGLGFSCFALKTYYTTGLWDSVPARDRAAWTAYLKSFQRGRSFLHDRYHYNAFIDGPVLAAVRRQAPLHERIRQRLFPPARLTEVQRLLIAETKQAIATLAQVGQAPERPYCGFPLTMRDAALFLENLDWHEPWSAGGQASSLAVLLKTQAPLLCGTAEVRELTALCGRFFESLADKKTGGYFRGAAPSHGELVSGAMKILTALDWLALPVHYPEALIETCLQGVPPAEACHVVNAVYVLYRCLQQTSHEKDKVQAYCANLADSIRQYYNPDGGFSYCIGRSQLHYYNVPISQGYAESDIHGTCLLTWALAMLFAIMDDQAFSWKVIKP